MVYIQNTGDSSEFANPLRIANLRIDTVEKHETAFGPTLCERYMGFDSDKIVQVRLKWKQET